MINLFDSYTTKSRDLHIAMQLAGYRQPAVAINDDGWLPEDVDSPLHYFLQQAGAKFEGTPRYFNQIDLPHFWEIQANGNEGQIYDQEVRRGKINFVRSDNSRLVKSVEWFDREGRTRLIEGYNQWGWKFSQTNRDQRGQDILTTYLTAAGREVLVENHQTGVITYNQPNGGIRLFTNRAAMTAAYLKSAGYQLDRIAFNNLGTPLFTVLDLLPETKENLLFWQESLQEGIPGNMQFIFDGGAGNTRVIIQSRTAYQQLLQMISSAEQDKVSYLGYLYPFKRENGGRPSALTLTYSDQIEHLGDLATMLPEVTFHVAATTEMSPKLLALGQLANVRLYPIASRNQISQLEAASDIYLDINRGGELANAGRVAFENNMVILGFNETLHQPRYVAAENRFPLVNWEQMGELIHQVLTNKKALDDHIQAQREAADQGLPREYRENLH